MHGQLGKTIKDFIWEQNISLDDREYMYALPEDDLVVFKTTGGESVLIVRRVEGEKYELLLQVGINTDTLVLGLLKKKEVVLYNFRAVGSQQIKIIGEKEINDCRPAEMFEGVDGCSLVYLLSELLPGHKLVTYRVGVYEISD